MRRLRSPRASPTRPARRRPTDTSCRNRSGWGREPIAGLDALLESGGQRDAFEARPGGTTTADRQVDLGVVGVTEVVLATHHRLDVPGAGLDRDQRGIGVVGAIVWITLETRVGQPAGDRRFGLGLRVEVEGGVDAQSAAVEQFGAFGPGGPKLRVVEKPLPHFGDEVPGGEGGLARRGALGDHAEGEDLAVFAVSGLM